MNGRLIQNNLYSVHEVLQGLENGTEAALINVDQFKAFDSVDHRFLVTVLETAGFNPEFRKWISMVYDKHEAVVQLNRKRSEDFVIVRSVQQGCPPCLETLLRRLRDEKASPALRGIHFAGHPHTKLISLSLWPAVLKKACEEGGCEVQTDQI